MNMHDAVEKGVIEAVVGGEDDGDERGGGAVRMNHGAESRGGSSPSDLPEEANFEDERDPTEEASYWRETREER